MACTHIIHFGVRFLLVLATVAGHLQGQSGADPTAQRITALIKQLGDEAFSKREAASRGLEEIGEQALPFLRKAAAQSDDLEVSHESVGQKM